MDFDVVIVGAGIAGLIIANDLVKNYNVLLIEKKDSISYKSWICKKKILVDNDLDMYIGTPFNKYYMKPNNNEKVYFSCNYVGVNDIDLMDDLVKRFVERGGTLKYNTECIDDKKVNKDKTSVITNNGIFTCRIIIDCSGYNSNLGLKHKLYKNALFHHIYGEIYNVNLDDSQINMLSVYEKNMPIYYFDTIPGGVNELATYTFQFTKKIDNYDKLIEMQEKNILHYQKDENINLGRPIRIVQGVIPLGTVRCNSDDNIFFFGDSANIAPYFSGVGFSYIIKYHKDIYKHINNCLLNNKLTKKDLSVKYTSNELITRNLHNIISNIFYVMTPKKYEYLISSMEGLSSVIVDRLYFGDMTAKELKNLVCFCFKKKKFIKVILGSIKFKTFIPIFSSGVKLIYYIIRYNSKDYNDLDINC